MRAATVKKAIAVTTSGPREDVIVIDSPTPPLRCVGNHHTIVNYSRDAVEWINDTQGLLPCQCGKTATLVEKTA